MSSNEYVIKLVKLTQNARDDNNRLFSLLNNYDSMTDEAEKKMF